jgi:hypothetical protein
MIKKMTKRTRTILFLICLFLFLLIAPSAILYSQGYRIDINPPASGIKITQTGGLFLKAEPRQVKVFIDGKLKKKTDFFFGSVLIENLLPKKYKIQIKKDGYYPWEKNLEIREKEVTEAKNIVLIPENPNFNILTDKVKDFWFSPDERKIILLEENPPAGGEQGWALKLYNLERDVKSHLIDELSFISSFRSAREIDEKDISQEKVKLLSLKFSSNSKEIFLEVGMEEQLKYFTLEIDKMPPVLAEGEEPLPPFEDVLTYKAIGQDIYYLNNLGYLFKNPSIAKGEDEGEAFIDYEEQLTEKPFPVKPETKYTLEILQDFIFLRESQTLYQFNPDSKSFEKFFEPIKDLKISPDYKKIVYFSDCEIWILFIKNGESSPIHQSGERVFLIRLSEKIKDVLWLNSNYLVFNAGTKLKIAEIDDRDKINIVNVAEFKTPEIFWNQLDKKLYVLSDGIFYQSESLLP